MPSLECVKLFEARNSPEYLCSAYDLANRTHSNMWRGIQRSLPTRPKQKLEDENQIHSEEVENGSWVEVVTTKRVNNLADAELCSRCRGLIINLPVEPQGAEIFQAYCGAKFFIGYASEILSAYRNGCRFCTLIVDSYGAERFKEIFLKHSLGMTGQVLGHVGLPSQKFWIECSNSAVFFQRPFDLCAVPDHPLPNIWNVNPPRNADCKEMFDRVHELLDQCIDHHDCGIIPDTELPSRVLDVSDNATSTVRLLVTVEGSATHGKYVALSYCRGVAQGLNTTSDTLDKMKVGIDLSIMPKTIQDAVLVTRGLGIRYLWVDALCILQGYDDSARLDFHREAARMERIYSNAFLTISATRGSDAGLFFTRCVAMPFCDGLGRSGKVNVVRYSKLRFGTEPIHRRAWTLQERLLSRRVLHYCNGHMVWECDNGLIKEDVMQGSVQKIIFSQEDRYRLPRNLSGKDWRMIVQIYSGRLLSVSSDKLPALAGIARRYHQLTGDRYVAGLWERELVVDLLWYRPNPQGTGLPPEYRAPTWSWASRDGRINFLFENGLQGFDSSEFVASVLESSVTLLATDEFGPVTDGKIVVQGPLALAKDVGIDFPSSTIGASGHTLYFDDGVEIFSAYGEHMSKIHCFLIAKPRECYGLMLLPAEDMPDHFFRLGMFWTYRSSLCPCWDGIPERTITIL
ncbi:heterokaryon incompatibility protein-domain-containing protein [Lineolata rhizophorae]|uniref:Heterokaryon incompatibility protein-domain-containing protein n=1 Tax=Lineolata rhizophorae TaxID=578093 RepID=A0A6A6NQ39_9PEZI|nr:heterokaryon incompatibility protein-domain-containing protein [Lineolata rhizophorae]